jgi:zinc transport system ATP-binding protein
MNNILEGNDINFSYNNQIVLENVNFQVEENDFMAVVGPNGGGKSTLLKLILGFLKPVSGSIKIFGEDPVLARKHIGYVPQFATFDFDFPINVLEMIMLSNLNSKSFFPFYKKNEIKSAHEVLEKLQIENLWDRQVSDLSGGQRQRALIARSLISNPKLLLLDEPTASVDIHVEKDIYALLKSLNKNMAILLVTHDVSFVSKFVNKIVCVNRCSCFHKISEMKDIHLQSIYSGDFTEINHSCKL